MSKYITFQLAINCGLIRTDSAAKLCVMSYPGHPKGCPNLGKKEGCPPRVDPLPDGEYRIYAVQFDIAAWAAKMRQDNPGWSDRQCRCCLYWQGMSRRALKDWLQENKADQAIMCPEARGANITAMMGKAGHPLQWPPVDYVWTVALGPVAASSPKRFAEMFAALRQKGRLLSR